jgi:hypothetical protein
MATNDLTTLADVKAWLGRTDTNSDALLAGLITRTSRQIHSWLQRPLLLPHGVSEIHPGRRVIVLREWPVMAVTSVTIDGVTLAEATDSEAGWTLEPWNGVPPGRLQAITLRHPGEAGRIAISYTAGYGIANEPQMVSAGGATAAVPYGAWAGDGGVTYANGAPLMAVAISPATGQYALGATPGQYVFNAGDDGAAVLIGYGFVPSDLADAAIELVSERYRYAQRIGEKSHSLGGNETVSFDTTRLTPLVTSLLGPYRNVAPL